MYKSQKIAVFYHLYQTNNWSEMLTAQYARMQTAGLAEHIDYFHIGINSDDLKPLPNIRVDYVAFNINKESEADTMRAMWEFCQHYRDYNVLYFHSKGVSHSWFDGSSWINRTDIHVSSWVEYLEYFVIDRWRACLHQLQTHDCVGTEWLPQHIIELNSIASSHYAGNFWWARSNYLATLDPTFLYQSRHHPELWINTNSPNYYSFWFSNRDLYWHALNPNEYKNLLLDEL